MCRTMTYKTRKRHRRKQRGGFRRKSFFLSPGVRNKVQYGYGIRKNYGIAPRKNFYIHK